MIQVLRTCQCKEHEFNLWSKKIPHTARQLSPRPTTIETMLKSPCSMKREVRSPQLEKAHMRQWRPNADINRYIFKGVFRIKETWRHGKKCIAKIKMVKKNVGHSK